MMYIFFRTGIVLQCLLCGGADFNVGKAAFHLLKVCCSAQSPVIAGTVLHDHHRFR